ncbi:hypothetical protein DL237_00280 [Pseudooceanicola sediminis]|uniref:Uncharacterized protein n=1 Tax=Pseudooceanicola sediminis TaxID=2211117 RepID=A0A399J7J7_9RHOB|nr:hypothetical protein DL237_00280 [Pseudooceanicola sediminis]
MAQGLAVLPGDGAIAIVDRQARLCGVTAATSARRAAPFLFHAAPSLALRRRGAVNPAAWS